MTTKIGRLGALCVASALAAAAVGAAAIGAATPAGAATPPCSGVGAPIPGTQPSLHWNGCVDAGAGLNARTHDGLGDVTSADVSRTPLETYPFNTRLFVHCYLNGPSVTGPFGATKIWDVVAEFQEPGDPIPSVYVGGGPLHFVVVSDAWVYTGTNNPVVPKCNGSN